MKLLQKGNLLCNASCHNAKGDICKCICGGALHGKGSEAQSLMDSLDLSALGVHLPPALKEKPERKIRKSVLDTKTNITYPSLSQCGKELAHLIGESPLGHYVFYALARAFPGRFQIEGEKVEKGTGLGTGLGTGPETGEEVIKE